MPRTLRPIGPVTPALRSLGYRQYAAVFVDGVQVPNVAVLSKQVGDKIKFVGHWIDSNGEVSVTNPMLDMKKAASRIMALRELSMPTESAPAPVAKPAAKRTAPKRRPAAKQRATTVHSIDQSEPGSKLVDCKGCGFLHRDDAMCV